MTTNSLPERESGSDGAQSEQMPENGSEVTRYDELWLNSWLRPILITVLIGCLDVAFAGFLRRVLPDLTDMQTTLLILLPVAATLIGGYTTTLLVRPGQRGRRNLGYRLAEFGLLLFAVRILLWALVEGWPAWEQMFYRPVDAVLTPFFSLMLLPVFFSWAGAILVTSEFLGMALRPDELVERSGSYRDGAVHDSRVRSDRGRLLAQFTERWITGGVLLLLLVAGSRVEFGGNTLFSISGGIRIPTMVIVASVVYFLSGLILIAIGRLAVLRVQWQIEEVPGSAAVSRSWPAYALGLILVVGIVAALLPFGSTFWLARILFFILQAIYLVVYLLLGLVIAALTALLPQNETEEQPFEAVDFQPPEPVDPTAQPLPPWIGSSVFWLLLAGLVCYAAYIYFRGRGVSFDWLKELWRAIRQRWAELWGDDGQAYVGLDEGEHSRNTGPVARWRRRLRRFWPGRMDANQRVRYYYLTMLDDADEQDVGRRPGETPFRYAPRLQRTLDEVDREVFDLTQEFVEVHYGDRNVEEDEVSHVTVAWRRIRAAIKRLRGLRNQDE